MPTTKYPRKKSVKEYFSLIWLNLTVKARNLIEFCKIVCKYYSNPSFFKADISLLWMYAFHNPFSISKRFLLEKGETNIYTYGETPLTTIDHIAKECNFRDTDSIYELGCGRGRVCFWLSTIVGCKTVGIEMVPTFVDRANRIKILAGIKNVTFILSDMLNVDYSDATICYLYGTCLDDASIRTLIQRFSKMAPGTKIITVSYPLTDYTDKPYFEILKHFDAEFTWGRAEVFIHLVKDLHRP